MSLPSTHFPHPYTLAQLDTPQLHKQNSQLTLPSHPQQLNILPRYQRSFVNTHANGLLLQYALNPPSQGGLGLRRMQWFANAANERSQTAARRLGFVFEGVLRWHRTLPPGKISAGADKGREPDDGRGGARHSALLSLCWDDWVDGGRERIQMLMER